MVDEFEESELVFEEETHKINNNEVSDFEGYPNCFESKLESKLGYPNCFESKLESELDSSSSMPKKKKLRMTNICKKKKTSSSNISVPIKIPDVMINGGGGGGRPPSPWFKKLMKMADNDGDDEGGEMVPPHLIIGRRIATGEMMSFSVCSGNGRTLKGRDLKQVRNSILRLTGFLET